MAEGAVSGLVDLRLAGDVAGLCRATGSDSIDVAAFATCTLGHGTGTPGVVETLLARLWQRGERPVGSRWQAARALGRLRADRAVPDLLRLLAADPHDREQLDRPAADSLVDIGGPQVVRGLLDLLEEQTATGKGTFRVVDALARLRAPEAVRPLLAALWHCLPDSAEHVVRALGEIGDPRAGSALLVLAQSPASDTRLRRAALRALHGLPEAAWPPAHPYPAPETLLHAPQRDPDPETARRATALLARTADGREHLWHVVREAARTPDAPECPPHAVAAVCAQVAAEPGRFVASAPGAYHALLRHHLGESAAPTVRRAAAGALAAFSGPLAVGDLLAALGDPHVSDTAADLVAGLAHPPLHRLLGLLTTAGQQRGAARALGGIGDAAAAPALLALATDHAAPAAARASAADALGALGHRQAAAPLAALAADEEQPGTLRARAVRALGLIGAPESLPVVLACARSPHEAVRARAVAALGGFPVPEAVRALGEFVRGRTGPGGTGPGDAGADGTGAEVARAAVRALGRVGAPALPVVAALAGGADALGDDLAELLVAVLAARPEAKATAALVRLAARPPLEAKARYAAPPGGPLALSSPAREAASLALVDRGTPEDLTPLTALLAPDAWFGAQEAAVQALLTIGTTEAHDHVLAFCRRATHFYDWHVDALNTIAEARGVRLG
ncbi:PBS lyase HEAT-like repeat protein [Streptomyces sp. YIM 121038]|uniref:HEAT repeat domain-containing protein n=1 Tax=Streptomyces sp. YIM 121038 TaxID=2136401 RepID=UPI0011103684|nr:HEAT repeat domain-containing protein [Streptomyces sp. YIM 121038]QCX79691.1 PBS lyase HEAT-like repeat protein [Streptomyces sp. YIM 121038]